MIDLKWLRVGAAVLLAVALAVSCANAAVRVQKVDDLIQQLKSDKSTVHKEAADALAKIGAPAIKPLLDLLGSEERYEYAVEARHRISSNRASPALKRCS